MVIYLFKQDLKTSKAYVKKINDIYLNINIWLTAVFQIFYEI